MTSPLRRIAFDSLDEVFARNPRLLRRIKRNERDLYTALANATGAARARIAELFGDTFQQELRQLLQPNRVTPADTRAYQEMFSGGAARAVGTYDDVVGAIADAGLGPAGRGAAGLVQADHLVEQRIHKMLSEGIDEFEARTVGARRPPAEPDVVGDAVALAVPTNQIVFYRMARHMQGRWTPPYFHVGPYSKTSRMNQLVPHNLEGHFTYQELYDATRWVLLHEMGLPEEPFGSLIRRDFLDPIEDSIEASDDTRRLLLPFLGNPRAGQVRERLELRLLQDRPLTAADFSPASWPTVPDPLATTLGLGGS